MLFRKATQLRLSNLYLMRKNEEKLVWSIRNNKDIEKITIGQKAN